MIAAPIAKGSHSLRRLYSASVSAVLRRVGDSSWCLKGDELRFSSFLFVSGV